MNLIGKIFLPLLIGGFFVSMIHAQVIPDEDWGYVTVRKDAHMFWWLYGTMAATNRTDIPLVMWLQGGPGASSTGFGNFGEIGPLDLDLKPRPHNWVESANVLFVDNPVGTGYSYVENSLAFTTNEDQIAADLVTLFRAFLSRYPSFKGTPFYIFSESYGGKMASSFAKALYEAIQERTIETDFRGVALGNAWMKPMSFVNTWAPFLLATAEIDEVGYKKIQAKAQLTQKAVDEKKWSYATDLWAQTEDVVQEVSAGIDFYNILYRGGSNKLSQGTNSLERRAENHLRTYAADPLTQLMNGPIKTKLKIPKNITWGGQSNAVFRHLVNDFMQSLVGTVDHLLKINVPVIVYTGHLDLICCSLGTMDWMEDLTWDGYSSWKAAKRETIYDSQGIVVGFEKSFKNLKFFTILSAGHMVPTDQPEAAEIMLRKVIAQQ